MDQYSLASRIPLNMPYMPLICLTFAPSLMGPCSILGNFSNWGPLEVGGPGQVAPLATSWKFVAFSKMLVRSIHISHNLASKSYCNISKFKLTLLRQNTIYLSAITVLVFPIHVIKHRYFCLRHPVHEKIWYFSESKTIYWCALPWLKLTK